MVMYPLLFGGEEHRPPGVVLDEADDARRKTERVGHRAACYARRTAKFAGSRPHSPPRVHLVDAFVSTFYWRRSAGQPQSAQELERDSRVLGARAREIVGRDRCSIRAA
jgi:hypothetical protein